MSKDGDRLSERKRSSSGKNPPLFSISTSSAILPTNDFGLGGNSFLLVSSSSSSSLSSPPPLPLRRLLPELPPPTPPQPLASLPRLRRLPHPLRYDRLLPCSGGSQDVGLQVLSPGSGSGPSTASSSCPGAASAQATGRGTQTPWPWPARSLCPATTAGFWPHVTPPGHSLPPAPVFCCPATATAAAPPAAVPPAAGSPSYVYMSLLPCPQWAWPQPLSWLPALACSGITILIR